MQSSVTYSPEDNKIRLYVGRVPRDEYERLRAAGFVSTPKQECDFVATWTPSREDLAREYLEDGDDIGDEDYSPEERAADRAERFSGYRDKRAAEAGASADAFEAGPSAFGHQNRARAERQAASHDRKRVFAVSQWAKAEYWQQRTAAVISHALHRSSPHVRRGRILTLEAEQRKHLKGMEEAQARYDAWTRVATMDGADELLPTNEDGNVIPAQMNAAQRLAYTLANTHSYVHIYHPTSEEANEEARRVWKHGFSTYDFLTKTEFIHKPFERLTPKQVAELYLANVRNPATPGTSSARWAAHYELRLTYEKAMLEADGGMVAEADIEPGGWIQTNGRARGCLNDAAAGWVQVQKVNRSPATKRVTSVQVWGTTSGYTRESNYEEYATRPALVTIDVERLGADAYRAPTDEERAEFKKATKARKAEAKATKPKTPSLVNPTEEDAERLQALLNAAGERKHKEKDRYSDYKPTPVLRMTQAQYSANSKGNYSHFETRTLHNGGGVVARRSSNMYTTECSRYDNALGPAVCKARVRYSSGWYNPPHIVVITDKPQKPLPLDWEAVADALLNTEAVTA